MAKKTSKKKTKNKTEEKITKETKELVEEIAEGKTNPFDAMFDEGPAPEPMEAVTGRIKEKIKDNDPLAGMIPYYNKKKRHTVYKHPVTHRKIIVEDKREAV